MKYNETDTYCYKCVPDVLINKYNIKDGDTLDDRIIEDQIKIVNDIKIHQPYSMSTLQEIHKKLFSCAFTWAGQIRTVDIDKGKTKFCTNTRIIPEGDKIFKDLNELNQDIIQLHNIYDIKDTKDKNQNFYLLRLGIIISSLNMLHPFREGNGRTLRLFVELFFNNLGIHITLYNKSERWMNASIDDDALAFASLLLDCF